MYSKNTIFLRSRRRHVRVGTLANYSTGFCQQVRSKKFLSSKQILAATGQCRETQICSKIVPLGECIILDIAWYQSFLEKLEPSNADSKMLWGKRDSHFGLVHRASYCILSDSVRYFLNNIKRHNTSDPWIMLVHLSMVMKDVCTRRHDSIQKLTINSQVIANIVYVTNMDRVSFWLHFLRRKFAKREHLQSFFKKTLNR